jgi:phospholipase C
VAERVHPLDEERGDRHPLPMSRRRFLERSAYAIAGTALFSCTGGRVIPRVDDVTPQIDTRWPIKRVVYVMLENRSLNNVFGRFPGVRGTRIGVSLGRELRLGRCPDWLPGDIPHDRAAHLLHTNGGKMDGFASGRYGDPWAYTQFSEEQIPNYWLWAREYSLSNNFFASVGGPSYPNHFFFVAGQSGGALDNPENIEVRREAGRVIKSWGCDAEGADVFVFVKDDRGNLTKRNTCFNFKTVGEQLTEIGVDWAYYSAPPGITGYFWNAYNGIGNVFHTDLWHEHIRSTERTADSPGLLADIEAGRLPAVTWVTPRFELSDHPPASTSFSHNWVTRVVNAIMRSDMWEHTAIFLTWDEWGGFYDPVVPPVLDDLGLGVRVPLLTISPYTRRGLIDDELGEFSTPLRFISDNWGLEPLTRRIRRAHNFGHVFDFSKPPRPPVISEDRAPTYGTFREHPESFPEWPPGTVAIEDQPDGGPPWPGG